MSSTFHILPARFRAYLRHPKVRAAWLSFFWGAVLVYFLFAALVLTTRWILLPQVDKYKDDIARFLGEALHAEVSIGRVSPRWDTFWPQLSLRDVVIERPDPRSTDANILHLPQVEASFYWRSVLGQPIFRKLEVPDAEITVRHVGEGVFDVLLWSDCVPADGGVSPFYDASDLRQVRLRTAAYEACTDYKDAACASLAGVGVTSEGGSVEAVMERPLAKYRIVARDIDRYRRLEGVPAVKDLTVSVSCEGFFPSSFNVAAGKPNNAVEGVGYASRPSWTTDADGLTELASDYVMVNGSESSVRLTVSVTAPDGSVVARTRGVKVPYRRGRLTTVAGDFLTAGRGGGGADIDTSWDDTTHEVEF